MITIIAYWLLIQIILSVFFGVDRSMIACGIVGFSPKRKLTTQQKQKIYIKIKMLGLFSQTRGEDGCGIYINGKVYKGHHDGFQGVDTKEWQKFITQKDWVLPMYTENGSIILHTRKASIGVKKSANNHPFYIEAEDEKNNLIFCHNGGIRNIDELCKKYEIETKGMDVDSEKLGHIIANKGFGVLSEYEGDAALMFLNPLDDSTMFVYHGKSKKYKAGLESEERPMYYLVTQEGIYFSSIENSLNAIRENDEQKPVCFAYNQVIQFTNGECRGIVAEVDRGECNVEQYSNNYNNCYKGCYPVPVHNRNRDYGYQPRLPLESIPVENLIERETMPLKAKRLIEEGITDFIYYRHNRYYRADTGKMCDGAMRISKKGLIVKDSKELYNVRTHYFWEGVMLKNESCFNKIISMYTDEKSFICDDTLNTAYYLSEYSMYPITNVFKEASKISASYRWMYHEYGKAMHYAITISPLYSQRQYKYDRGYLQSIKVSMPEDTLVFEEKQPKAKDKVLEIADFNSNSIYDVVFLTKKEAYDTMNENEWLALMAHIEDKSMVPLEMDPEQLRMAAGDALREAVEKKTSIRNIIGDKTGELDKLLMLIDGLSKAKEVETIDSKLLEIEEIVPEVEVDESTVEDSMDILKELTERGEEMELETDPFIQDFGYTLKRGLENTVHSLAEVCEKHQKTELIGELTKL